MELSLKIVKIQDKFLMSSGVLLENVKIENGAIIFTKATPIVLTFFSDGGDKKIRNMIYDKTFDLYRGIENIKVDIKRSTKKIYNIEKKIKEFESEVYESDLRIHKIKMFDVITEMLYDPYNKWQFYLKLNEGYERDGMVIIDFKKHLNAVEKI